MNTTASVKKSNAIDLMTNAGWIKRELGWEGLDRSETIDRLMRLLDKEPHARFIRARNADSAQQAQDPTPRGRDFKRRPKTEQNYWERQTWLQLFKREELLWKNLNMSNDEVADTE